MRVRNGSSRETGAAGGKDGSCLGPPERLRPRPDPGFAYLYLLPYLRQCIHGARNSTGMPSGRRQLWTVATRALMTRAGAALRWRPQLDFKYYSTGVDAEEPTNSRDSADRIYRQPFRNRIRAQIRNPACPPWGPRSAFRGTIGCCRHRQVPAVRRGRAETSLSPTRAS
jgi:hypothetical protein